MKNPKRHILITAAIAICLAAASARAGDPTPAQPAPANPSGDKSVADLLGELKKTSQASTDPELKSLGNDLSSKVASLSKSLGNNPEMQGQLQGALKSLLGDKGSSALGGLQKLSAAKLTPDQSKLAKDVYHTGSAYLVQKNFGSLEGSQTEVAQLVNSLRKGNYTDTLAPLKKIGQNSKLTQPQKDFLSSLTDQYAPGLKKAGDALKNIPGLSK